MCNGLFERSERGRGERALAEFMKAEKIFVSRAQKRRRTERASDLNAWLMLISSHLESRLNAGTTWQWHRLRTMRTNLAAAGFENKQIPKSSSHVLQHRLFSVDARTGRRVQTARHSPWPGPPSAIFRHPLLIRAARRSECQAEAGQPRRAAEASLLSLPKAPFVSKLLIHGLTHSLSPGQLSRPTSLLGNYAPS